MSENKNWRKEMKEIVQDVLKDWKSDQKPTPAPSVKPDANAEHPSHSLEELLDCPDCYPKVKEAVLKKEILSRKDKEYVCVDCGTGVDETEENCPTCGGKEARHR